MQNTGMDGLEECGFEMQRRKELCGYHRSVDTKIMSEFIMIALSQVAD
jgi:hypothetical protein